MRRKQGRKKFPRTRGDILAKDVLTHWDVQSVYDEELRKHLETQFSYRYPYLDEQKLKLKFTVSELKKRAYLEEESGESVYEEPEVIPLIPRFLKEEEELTGASRGSAYHKLLELLDFRREYDAETLSDAIGQLRAEKKLSKEMADCIRISDIMEFCSADPGEGCREQPWRISFLKNSRLFSEWMRGNLSGYNK